MRAALLPELGDVDPSHHGEPQFRAAMVRAGQDAHDLPMQAAFEKGAKLVGLKIRLVGESYKKAPPS